MQFRVRLPIKRPNRVVEIVLYEKTECRVHERVTARPPWNARILIVPAGKTGEVKVLSGEACFYVVIEEFQTCAFPAGAFSRGTSKLH